MRVQSCCQATALLSTTKAPTQVICANQRFSVSISHVWLCVVQTRAAIMNPLASKVLIDTIAVGLPGDAALELGVTIAAQV